MDSTDVNANSYLGVAYLQIDKPDRAISFLEKAVNLYKEDYYSYYYLGLAFYSKMKYKEAELAFSSGIKFCTFSSLYPQMYKMRGNSLVKLNNFEEAITDFNSAIKYSPDDPSLYYERGKAMLELRRYPEAINSLKQAEKLGSQSASSLLREIIN